MNENEKASEFQRYIALDIHKEYVMVGAWNVTQEWVIRPRRVITSYSIHYTKLYDYGEGIWAEWRVSMYLFRQQNTIINEQQ